MRGKELEMFSQAIAAAYDMAVDPLHYAARASALASQNATSLPADIDALLRSHVERAQQLRKYLEKLRLDRLLRETMLDAIAVGALITDASGRLLHATRIAAQLLQEERGLVLREGRVETAARTLTQKLHQQIQRVALGAAKAKKYLSVHTADGAEMQLHITALPESVGPLDFGETGALIYCHDTRMPRRSLAEILEHLFQLTPAESQVADALLRGMSLKDYAEERQLSIHTVKNQLKSVFEKTGHASQITFVHGVLSNPLVVVASLFTHAGVID